MSPQLAERLRAAWPRQQQRFTLLLARVARLEQDLQEQSGHTAAHPGRADAGSRADRRVTHTDTDHDTAESTPEGAAPDGARRSGGAGGEDRALVERLQAALAVARGEHAQELRAARDEADAQLRAAMKAAQSWEAPQQEGHQRQVAQLHQQLDSAQQEAEAARIREAEAARELAGRERDAQDMRGRLEETQAAVQRLQVRTPCERWLHSSSRAPVPPALVHV